MGPSLSLSRGPSGHYTTVLAPVSLEHHNLEIGERRAACSYCSFSLALSMMLFVLCLRVFWPRLLGCARMHRSFLSLLSRLVLCLFWTLKRKIEII